MPFDSTSYNDWVNQFKSKLQSSLNQWIPMAGATAGQLLRSLRDKASQWWYFLDYPEVPPDNNLAERSLLFSCDKTLVLVAVPVQSSGFNTLPIC